MAILEGNNAEACMSNRCCHHHHKMLCISVLLKVLPEADPEKRTLVQIA